MKLFQKFLSYVPDDKALSLLCGLYQSSFRGRGLEYQDLRQYMPGDDPRILSWAKLAQTGSLYSKTFSEERDLIVYLIVDPSPAISWRRPEKAMLFVETVALLAFSSLKSRDRLGICCGKKGDLHVQLVRATRAGGLSHAARMVEEVALYFDETRERQEKGEALAQSPHAMKECLSLVSREVKKSGALIFILSDFLYLDQETCSQLTSLHHQADCIPVRILDGWDTQPIGLGEMPLSDLSKTVSYGPFVDRFHAGKAKTLQELLNARQQMAKEYFLSQKMEVVEIWEEEKVEVDPAAGITHPYIALKRFFEKRREKKRRRL